MAAEHLPRDLVRSSSG